MRIPVILASTLLAFGAPLFAQSTPPATLPFQARLTLQGSGADVNGFLGMSFRVYATPVGGSALWTEMHPFVQVTRGLFKVELGSVTGMPSTLFDNGDLY